MEVTCDPAVVSYGTLLKVFCTIALHPTQSNIMYNDLPKLAALNRRMPEVYVTQ